MRKRSKSVNVSRNRIALMKPELVAGLWTLTSVWIGNFFDGRCLSVRSGEDREECRLATTGVRRRGVARGVARRDLAWRGMGGDFSSLKVRIQISTTN